MLQVCLNGARGPREHHHLPVRPPELAKAAADSVAAGATDIHLHPKTPDGTDSLDPATVAAAVHAVRAAAPGIPVGITTGSWTTPDTRSRLAAIHSWTVLPDHASVNWHEQDAADIAHALLQRGIGVEAGIPSGTDAERNLARWPHRNRILRVLARVTDPTANGASVTAETLLARLDTGNIPILLHGRGAGTWAVLDLAARHGLHTRIGLEDTLTLPDGDIAADNAALVTAARTIT
ncbi:3-keto-5-aminohexanoate cleavage protein [Actinopolyspora mortivallis]|uniref:3-keto-5-aminohexanoate cleavage protein n=1 Tax=Actinopolyspora mortivallis TaxID=33906 RepID=UPI00047C5295|nr:3-keto-5-aminohexanoate cleavage protein [Actinopolyspora mortivallis]